MNFEERIDALTMNLELHERSSNQRLDRIEQVLGALAEAQVKTEENIDSLIAAQKQTDERINKLVRVVASHESRIRKVEGQ